MSAPNYINHTVFVLDASGSMTPHQDAVIRVTDDQIQHLARRSQELSQETRATVYAFGGTGRQTCVYYDKDVMRTPSLRGTYQANMGQTALVDATLLALDDLKETPQRYGDHAFLVYVITDGEENDSQAKPAQLRQALASLPQNWTVACLVPNIMGVAEAKMFGFPEGNIAVWDTRSGRGFEEAGRTIRAATESFMTARAAGVRGTRSLFQVDVSPSAVRQAAAVGAVEALHPGQYRVLQVKLSAPIAEFVEANLGRPYHKGEAYYQLMKPETVQAQKAVAIRDNTSHQLYAGPAARQILGLPPYEVKVAPDFSPKHTIFIQSTSINRRLVPGTQLLVLS